MSLGSSGQCNNSSRGQCNNINSGQSKNVSSGQPNSASSGQSEHTCGGSSQAPGKQCSLNFSKRVHFSLSHVQMLSAALAREVMHSLTCRSGALVLHPLRVEEIQHICME